MQLIIKNRCEGKTTDLIRMSAETGIPIVCNMPDLVKKQAKAMDLSIPDPIAYSDYIHTPGKRHGQHRVYIDELDCFLRYAMDAEVECATLTMNSWR